MNIFVTSPCPTKSAQVLPDKLIVKMPVETCQLLSIVASDKWGHGYGTLPNCTIWVNESEENARWLIAHGFALCEEYAARYGKVHTCFKTLLVAREIFPTADPQGRSGKETTPFVRAMSDEYKLDTSINTFTAYKMYIASKPWVCDNYIRLPYRKPDWV